MLEYKCEANGEALHAVAQRAGVPYGWLYNLVRRRRTGQQTVNVVYLLQVCEAMGWNLAVALFGLEG